MKRYYLSYRDEISCSILAESENEAIEKFLKGEDVEDLEVNFDVLWPEFVEVTESGEELI